ncbi:phosphoglycerate mutase-like protein [Epithele typhae]|uniref:phosphoglycerate mutase-like protein n=1 Tax=Epithele typhae TaxID=378194 RepID=UPI002007474E|nr:phosphoglycerate mutase-like protein [Epithele typhae]KAH9922855.1 phosphoglycerate mutase-like protein [Epithele typhae]
MSEAKPTVIVTFRDLWAGWKDAPLSNHGMNEPQALAMSLSTTCLSAIYASPLKRALWTGQAVRDQQPDPKPPFQESPLIREQHFGVAEGRPWSWHQKENLSLEEHFAQGIYPVLHERHQHFPEGESVDDLFVRASRAIDELVMPHVWRAAREGKTEVHIALASHGLCIGELIPALLLKDSQGVHPGDQYRGLRNTAWTRLTVEVEVTCRVTDINRHEHLDNVVRQKGGIGSAAHDPKQQDIRAFFGGGKIANNVDLEEGRSLSNAKDEADVVIQGTRL